MKNTQPVHPIDSRIHEWYDRLPQWMRYAYQNNPTVNRTFNECAYLGKSYEEMRECVGEALLKRCESLEQEAMRLEPTGTNPAEEKK